MRLFARRVEHPLDMRALLLVAEHDFPAMFARIGVIRALNRHAGLCAPCQRFAETLADDLVLECRKPPADAV
jgi:hypothetical protein